MNFNNLSYEELDQHAMEQLVFESNEISSILRGHLFIEKILETLIAAHLPDPDALFKKQRSFELKLNLAMAMGLISIKYYSAFKALNNIRNNYAHQHEYKVSIEEISRLKFDWEDIQVKAFNMAVLQGVDEAVRISIIFLCWKAIHLIKEPK